MELQWWHVPGPTRFVQLIVQDLRSGKNVVLAFPPYAADGFREALGERVRENELWRWRTISASEFPCDGVAALSAALYERFIPNHQASDLCTASTLAQRLLGTIIWVDNAAGQAWHTWQKFLRQYQHACQNRELSDRSLFCLSLIGNPHGGPVADVALSVRRWEGMVGRLDMAFYVDRLLQSCFPQPLHHKVALAVVTELAGSDPHLADHLARKNLATIVNPFDVLGQFAAARGWTPESVRAAGWLEGMSDVVDGTRLLHSAAAAAIGNRGELSRRVWRGQVTVLYPFIEEQRVRIIPQIRGYLRLPVETTYGRVEDAEDVEVSQLLYFLRGKRVQPRLWRLLNYLTEMRHALAHLQPVPQRCLFAQEVLHPDD